MVQTKNNNLFHLPLFTLQIYLLLKAYEYQGDCCAKLNRPKEAIQAYGKYLDRATNDDSMNDVLRTVVSLAAESGGEMVPI